MASVRECNAENSPPTDRFDCDWPFCSPFVHKAKVTFSKQWEVKLHERFVKDDKGLWLFFSALLKNAYKS